MLPVAEDRPLDDDELLGLMRDRANTRVAIDAPFGWPVEFVDALGAYRDRLEWSVEDPRRLWYRETDREVKRLTNQKALSVSTEWIVYPAMRCAGLLSRLVLDGQEVDRSGAGRFVEVYPAAALRLWGLDPRRYKGDEPANIERRCALLEEFRRLVGQRLEVHPRFLELCEADDDQFDALICAVVARAVEVGKSHPVPSQHRDRARQEGWIHLPTPDALGGLFGST